MPALLSWGLLRQVPRLGPKKPSVSERFVTEEDTLHAPDGALGVLRLDFHPPGIDDGPLPDCPEAVRLMASACLPPL